MCGVYYEEDRRVEMYWTWLRSANGNSEKKKELIGTYIEREMVINDDTGGDDKGK